MSRNRYIHLLLLLLLAWGGGSGCTGRKRTNWSVLLRKDQKAPYDTYLAYQAAYHYFPDAATSNLYANFSFDDLLQRSSYQEGRGLLVMTGRSFHLSPQELDELIRFCRQGNEVLLLCSQIDEKLEQLLDCQMQAGGEYTRLNNSNKGSDNIGVLELSALPGKKFGMNGRNIRGFIHVRSQADSLPRIMEGHEAFIDKVPVVLGRAKGQPDFVQYGIGEGHLSIHASPLVFSNYFLLQPGNRDYMDQVWRSIPGNISNLYWASFTHRTPDTSSFTILMRHPATRWFLVITMTTLLLYVLFQQKRRQRPVPVLPPLSNSSAAFVETVGMLYYNKGDNANLARKMVQHFLEWVRSHYHLGTNQINDSFITQLSIRSGQPEAKVRELSDRIHALNLDTGPMSDNELMQLYQAIQEFYNIV